MKKPAKPMTLEFTCLMAICSYTEYKTNLLSAPEKEIYDAILETDLIKQFRFTKKSYYAEIALNIERVTDQFISICEKFATEASEVASEYIKIGQENHAKQILSEFLEMDLKAAGFKNDSKPTINIHTNIDHSDWFNVVICDPVYNIM